MKRLVTLLALVLMYFTTLFAADKPEWNGYWWADMSPSFKLGWVTGYAKAMDTAGSIQISTCVLNLPLYREKYPDVDPKEILQKMCLTNTDFDYDGISMGQFVNGMDAFYQDYRNKQLEVGWAIQYVRDEIKGKSAKELSDEVTLWRRCSVAYQTGDGGKIAKACAPDDSTLHSGK